MRLFIFLSFTLIASILHADTRWELLGTIVAISEEKQEMILEHHGLKGFSEEPGMLNVVVSAGDLAIAEIGREVRGILTKTDETFNFSSVWPADKKVERSMMLINRDLTRPRIGQNKKGLLKTGDELPRFAMYNQLGHLITPADLEGKLVLLNFIFTRSTVQSMSHAATDRLAEIQARLIKDGHSDSVRIISLSLDPEYDTPGVNYAYLNSRGVDHDTFWLLSGSDAALTYLRKEIGVVASPSQKTIINHSMVTLIADREGKIFYRKPGSRWDVDEIYNRLEILLTSP
ncbi:MAG: SCO family protein [Verrucomicrobia bacterium]|nr:SCO family protein [Verrucomicrobiota bacterium]MDA1068027.1 SCO family protein [Verrucomicrobiota bacterium]